MINSLFEDKCTQCAPPGRSRPHHWHGGFVALVAAAAFLLPIGQAYADDDDERIDIDNARWSNDRDRLTVDGDKAPDGSTVTIRYGERGDNGAVIGITESDGDGDWEFRISGLDPVPCDVTAQAAGVDDDDREVSNAPGNCSNDGGVVQPPPDQVCNIAVSPTTLAFGDVTVGNSPTLSTTVSNSGDANCDVILAQSGSNDFNVSGGNSFSVAPGGNQTVSVTYNPGGVGSDNGTLTVNSNDPDTATVNVALTGNGVQQQVNECNIAVSPTTLAFGNVNLGNSPTLSTTVSNNGAAACNVTLARTGSNDFAITSNTTFNVSPGGSQIVSVSYTPGQVGQDTGNVAVNSNDPGTPTVNVGLSGNGVDNNVPPVACVETPGNGPQTHADCISDYTGPEVCVDCHEGQARDMHGSVHYQQGGAFPNVTNIPLDFAAAGERPAQAAGDLVATGVNTYCGTHENSPRFTCAGCHVGNGRFPMAQSEFELLDPASTEAHAQLANIDCLICHQDVYKRFPDWTASGEGFEDFSLLNLEELPTGELIQSNGAVLPRTGFSGIPTVNPTTLDFQFLPAGSDTLPATVPMAPMALTTLEAAQQVHPTTRQTCLNCHAGAAGGDGTKRGDLSREVANNASITTDFHLSPQGADLTCSGCHSETLQDGTTTHRVRGRGLDLRPNDVAERFTCENSGCHNDTPHGDFSNTTGSSRDKHAQKVACQTCHIPSYAKAAVGTEVARDWQDPHPSAAACNGRGGWLPREDKDGLNGASLIPSYAWFDGTSEIYYLGESLDGVPTVPLDASVAASFAGNFNAGDPAYVIGMPNGDVASTSLGTKLYPMKEHWGKLARDDGDNTLIGHSTFEFFRTGSFCRAVAVGLGLDNVNVDPSDVCVGAPGSLEMPLGTTSVAVHTYQTINHGVEPRGDALNCGSCHSSQNGGPLQMDVGTLGYGPRTLPSVVQGTNVTNLNGDLDNICRQCHGNETNAQDREFTEVHDRHVQNLGRECSACHNFSRPERGLSLNN